MTYYYMTLWHIYDIYDILLYDIIWHNVTHIWRIWHNNMTIWHNHTKSSKDITKYTLLGCDPNDAAEFFFRWLFGWAVSSVAATIAYPFDTVRRLMMLQADLETKEYKHFIDCFKQLYAEYGILRFFKGQNFQNGILDPNWVGFGIFFNKSLSSDIRFSNLR